MHKIYLFCSAGMSTSLLASKMQKVATQHGLDIEVKAFSDNSIEKIVVERYGHLGKPIFVIDSEEYGNMDGERVLKRAILEIKKKKAESEGK